MTEPRPPLPPAVDPWSGTDPTPYAGAPHTGAPYAGSPRTGWLDGSLECPSCPPTRWLDPAYLPGYADPPGYDHTAVDHQPATPSLPSPPRKRQRLPWVLGAIAGALLCSAGATLAAPIWAEHPATIRLGENVAGLQRVRDRDVDRLASELTSWVREEQGAESAFAAVYADPRSSSRRAVLFGGTRFIAAPGAVLEAAIRGAGTTIAAATSYDPGALGGSVRCGDGRDDAKRAVVVCAWTDHGSLGVGILYGTRTQAEAARLFTQIREAILYRE